MKHNRTTKETKVTVDLKRVGKAQKVDMPDPFAGHMFATMARYAGWELTLDAESRDGVEHHVVEDAAITLGQAVAKLRADKPVARYGTALVPMDDALVEVALDAGGRAWYEGDLPTPMLAHALRSFAFEAGLTLHVDIRRGEDAHHVTEAAFKAVGMALRTALAPAESEISTKGTVQHGG